MEIPQLALSDWTSTLKVYQKTSMDTLLSNNAEEEAAKLWLSANGVAATKQFGGGASDPFWDRFALEFKEFICGNEKYEKEREQLSSQAPIANALFVSVISGAIGSSLGFAASLLAPAVAVLLFLVGKVGIGAYCKCS